MSTTTRIHVTIAADGLGDNATDEDRASFCAYVERRVEAMRPGSSCTTEIANVIRTTVAAPVGIDADELAGIIGTDLWEQWCAEGAPAS